MARFILVETLNRSIDYPIVEEVLSVGYYSVLMVLATFGNIFIIYATLKVRARSHDAMTILLIRVLAFNDLVGGLILYPNFILLLSKGYFPFNATYCIVLGIFEIYCPLCSTLLVMTLVLTKVAMIRNPFLSMGNARKIFLVLPPLYILGAIAPLGVFIELGHYMFSPERGTCTYQFYPDLLKEKIFVMTCTTLFVIIPLCVIICMSIYILRFIRRMRNKTKSMLEKANCQGRTKRSKDKKYNLFTVQRANDKILKSVVVVLLVVVAYVVCWSMFFCVTTVAFLIGGEETVPRQVLLWQKALLMTNNAVNPMVYVCGNKKLQLVLKQVMYRIRGLHLDNKDFNFSTIVHDTKPTFQQIGRSLTAFNTRSKPSPDLDKVPRRVSEMTPGEFAEMRTSPTGSPTLRAVRCVTLPIAGKETKRSQRKCIRLAVPTRTELLPDVETKKSDLLTEKSDVITKKKTIENSDVIFVANGHGEHGHRDDVSAEGSDVFIEESSVIPCDSVHDEDEIFAHPDDEEVLVKDGVSTTESHKSTNKDVGSDYDCRNDMILSSDPADQIILNRVQGLKLKEASEKMNGSILNDGL